VIVFGPLVGIAGGAMLYDERLGLYAFALLITHGIIDSADGQFARMTGRVTQRMPNGLHVEVESHRGTIDLSRASLVWRGSARGPRFAQTSNPHRSRK
jgi:hypothetical protein